MGRHASHCLWATTPFELLYCAQESADYLVNCAVPYRQGLRVSSDAGSQRSNGCADHPGDPIIFCRCEPLRSTTSSRGNPTLNSRLRNERSHLHSGGLTQDFPWLGPVPSLRKAAPHQLLRKHLEAAQHHLDRHRQHTMPPLQPIALSSRCARRLSTDSGPQIALHRRPCPSARESRPHRLPWHSGTRSAHGCARDQLRAS